MKPVIILAVGVVLAFPVSSWATCTSTFEICGDSIDNDCNGKTDEGCTSCGPSTWIMSPIYIFNSANEIRRRPGSQNYGRLVDAAWKFLPSHRMTNVAMTFSSFKMETDFDFFRFGSVSRTGTSGVTDTGAVGVPNTTALMDVEFETDTSVDDTGVLTEKLWATCANSGGQFRSVPTNMGVDGVLLYAGDNATFSFTVPANTNVFIVLDTEFASDSGKDFDIFINDTSVVTGFLAYNSFTAGAGKFKATGTSTTGEFLFISPQTTSKTYHGNINSWSGSGRFRLFIAKPVAFWTQDYDVCIQKNNPTSGELTRIKDSISSVYAWMLAATDGQYPIRGAVSLFDNESYVSALLGCDVWFSEETDPEPDCVTALASFALIEIMGPFWKGSATWTDDGQNCCNSLENCSQSAIRVGQTIAHEWGHYEPGISDEFDDSPVGTGCGVSLMAGTRLSNYTVGNSSFEFCSNSDHGIQPCTGCSITPSSANNWSDWDGEHSAMSTPIHHDFSQLREFQKEASAIMTFTGP